MHRQRLRRGRIGPAALSFFLSAILLPGARAAETEPQPMTGVRLVPACPGVTFSEPTCLVSQGEETLFVCEQPGRIVRLEKYRGQGPTPQPAVWLDLTGRIANKQQGGLLCMAFHPDFAANQRVFVTYVAPGPDQENRFEFRLSEFKGSGTACDPQTEKVLLKVPKRNAQHQAGCVAFGKDGMLYLSIGDSAVEPGKVPAANHPAQDPTNRLGKILRLDVNNGSPYSVPSDNPWAQYKGQSMAEIWGYGFRNPWRFDWDASGDLYVADPGTSGDGSREWILRVKKGGNHGWPYYEGDRVLSPMPADQEKNRVSPCFVYLSGSRTGAAVGGKFYTGKRVPSLQGKYVFCDYMRGEVYALDLSTGAGKDWRLIGKVQNPSSVGRDAQGELYVLSNATGVVYTLAAEG